MTNSRRIFSDRFSSSSFINKKVLEYLIGFIMLWMLVLWKILISVEFFFLKINNLKLNYQSGIYKITRNSIKLPASSSSVVNLNQLSNFLLVCFEMNNDGRYSFSCWRSKFCSCRFMLSVYTFELPYLTSQPKFFFLLEALNFSAKFLDYCKISLWPILNQIRRNTKKSPAS